MGGFGDRLRQAREARGETLERVAEATRIQRRHLEALERGELQSLPPAPFTKGYIKACAQFLDVDAQPILDAYSSELQRQGLDTPESRDKVLQELSHLVAQRSGGGERSLPRGRLAVFGLAALVLLAAAWLLSRPGWPPAVSGTPAVEPPVPRDAGERDSATAPAPSPTSVGAEAPAGAPPSAPNAAPKATPAPTPLPRRRSSADLRVADAGVGTGISNHRLVGRAGQFAEGTEVVFWTLVTGGEAGDGIRHVWFHGDQAVMRADLDIGGVHWRTFSRRVLPRGATGDWTVEARAADGRLLARQEFLSVPDER